MNDFIWLAAVVIGVMVLWLLWSLSRNFTTKPDLPDLELIRPAPSPPVSPVAGEDRTAIGLVKALGPPDDLRRIKGVGPKLNVLLGQLGVSRYDQIAAWTADDVALLDPHLGSFQGRPARDNWVEQAGFLARDDTAGFEARFGKLGG